MGSRPTRLVLVAAALLAAAASAASAAGLRVLVLHTPNRTDSNRTSATIDTIVIHTTEGHFLGSVRWLANSRSRGSAHFVVSRRGEIVQLVSVTDVAWHSGNTYVNRHSIGIEHEGWTARGGYAEPQYRASAQLVAYLAHRYGVPLDRAHIIGHNEVPNPYHPGRFGGIDGHRDPGRHWAWGRYMTLVHYYARHPVLPQHVRRMIIKPSAPAPAEIRRETPEAPSAPAAAPPRKRAVVDKGATVHGSALWWSGVTLDRKWRRHIYKVTFSVDGRVLYTDNTWPYSFHRHEGWDSRNVANGRHLLVVRAYGRHHYVARKTFKVRVDNPPVHVDVTGVANGGAVSGVTRIDVAPGERVDRVLLAVDGTTISRDLSAPYEVVWNTESLAEGPHEVVVTAQTRGGRLGVQRIPVVVANSADFPPVLAGDWVTS